MQTCDLTARRNRFGGSSNFCGKMPPRDVCGRVEEELVCRGGSVVCCTVVYRSFCHRLTVNRRLTLENQSAARARQTTI